MSCGPPDFIQPGLKDRLAELPARVRGPIEQEIAACIAQRTAAEQAPAEAAAPAAPAAAPTTPADVAAIIARIAEGGGGAFPSIFSCYSTPESFCYHTAQQRIYAAHREAYPELYVSPQHRGPLALHQAAQERQAARKGLFTSMGIAALLGFFLARR